MRKHATFSRFQFLMPFLLIFMLFVLVRTNFGQVEYVEDNQHEALSPDRNDSSTIAGDNWFYDKLSMPVGVVLHDVQTQKDLFLKKQADAKLSGMDSTKAPRFSKGFNPFPDAAEPVMDNFGANISVLPGINPASWPSSVHCKLLIHFGGTVHEASGVLIDSRAVVTSGHVLYNPAWGGWADQVEVIPAYSAPNKPFGNAMGAYFSVVEHWYYQDEYKEQFDLGMVLLGRPVGALTGWYGFASASDDFFFSHNFWNFNYPAAAPAANCCMYYRSGPFDAIYNNEILAVNNTYENGQDGSGAYYNDPTNGRMVYGVLSTPYPPPANNQTAFVRISWLKWLYIANTLDDYTPTSPFLIPLQVLASPAVIQSGDAFTSFSFKVHNYSLATFSGTQNVEIYLSTDKIITSSDMKISSGSFSATIGSLGTLTVNVPNLVITCAPQSVSNIFYIGVKLGSQVTSDQDVAQVEIVPPDPATHFTTELNWNTLLNPGSPVGVVADGISSLKIKLNRTAGIITINNINVELQTVSGQAAGALGMVGNTIQTASSSSCSLTNPSGNQWIFYFVAPDVYTTNTSDNSKLRQIKAVITISVGSPGSGDCYKLERIIEIIRPPVLLIHGLKSNQTCFESLRNDMVSSGRYYADQVKCVDYSWSNTWAFAENVNVVYWNLRFIKSDWQKNGFEVKKVDIVGHSMGGVISRLYLQSSDFDTDIHKLITVNTPHSGSQGANLLFDLPQLVRSLFGFDYPAVYDLRVNSNATRNFLNGPQRNIHKVPSHAIKTQKVFSLDPVFTSDPYYAALDFALKKFNTTVSDIFNGPSDLVVADSSQMGGLNTYSLIANEWHIGSPQNSLVKARIRDLLEQSSTGGSFSTSGFNPPILNWNPQNTKLQSNPNDSVTIIHPLPGMIVSNGQIINIQIHGTAAIHTLFLHVQESNDSVFVVDTITNNLNINYTVPQYVCGRLDILAFGLDSFGNDYVDSSYVIVQPTGTPDSIFISYPIDSLVVSQGLYGNIFVSCQYSNGIVRDITTLPQVQYTHHTNKTSLISQGVFKGKQQGKDTITVSYGGLSVNLPVHVGQYYLHVDSINRYDTICTGSSFIFYGHPYSTQGIYDTTFVNQYGCDSIIFLHLTVIQHPGAAGTIIGPANVCKGQTGVNYYINPVSNATSYTWTVPPGVTILSGAGTNSIQVSFPNSVLQGNLQVFGINRCFAGSSSPYYTVKTNIPYVGQVSLGNMTVGSNQKECRTGQVISVGGPGNPLIVQQGGTVNLLASEKIQLFPDTKVMSSGYFHAFITNLCIPCSAMKESDFESSEINTRHPQSYRIIPNPTTGRFTLEFTGQNDQAVAKISIFSILGEPIHKAEMTGMTKMDFSLEQQPAGLYLIMVHVNDWVETYKVIKK
jgi:V8-like Glu-specific endopeptidase/pimeloyl-ACP methyl ester carboxylesterase